MSEQSLDAAALAAPAKRRFRSPMIAGLTATTVAAVASTVIMAPQASADEQGDAIARMSQVSSEAAAKSEEVKALEDKIGQSQQQVDKLKAAADQFGAEADEAREALEAARNQVNNLAGAKYRGFDPASSMGVIGSKNPQSVIDRSTYLSTLANSNSETVDELANAMAEAGERRSAVQRTKFTAEFQQASLERELNKLNEEKAELQSRVDEVQAAVDSLSGEAKEAWENKNNPVAPMSSAVGDGVVGAAMAKIGSPYGWGAAGPDAFDCSGLMVWAFQQQGKSIPRTSQAQIAGGQSVDKASLQPGDLVGFYPGVTHVGMYIGNGQIVHASDYGIPVQVVSLDSMPFAGASRY